jgi:hypothetical protein
MPFKNTTKLRIHTIIFEIIAINRRANKHIVNNYKQFISSFNNVSNTAISVTLLKHNIWTLTYSYLKSKKHKSRIKKKQFESTFYYCYNNNPKNAKLLILLPKKYRNEAFDNMLRIIYSSLSIVQNTILIHASSIVKDNKIILFIGQSGAGKTTTAELSGCEVFHDDLLVLKEESKPYYSFTTCPFKPPYVKKELTREIKSIYYVSKDNTNYIQMLSKEEQLSYLLQSIWSFDEISYSEINNKKIVLICKEILQQTTVSILHIKKSNEFISLL